MNEPVGSTGCEEVVISISCLANITDCVVVNLVKTNCIPCCTESFVLKLNNHVCIVACTYLEVRSISSPDSSSRNFAVVSGVNVNVLICDVYVLGAFVAVSICSALEAEEIPHVEVNCLTVVKSSLDCGVTELENCLVNVLCI